MRKSLTLSILLLSIWYVSTSSRKDPNNPPAGRTGAPSESTCGAAGCHTGGTFVGTVSISGIPDTIVADQSYTVTLRHKSNAVRAGFQLTCLDSLNQKCGTLTAGTGTSLATLSSLNRQYVRQSTPKTLADSIATWTFTWKAPSTAGGNEARFYFISLAANGNGQRTGDNILISTDTMMFQAATSAVSDMDPRISMYVYPTQVSEVLHIDLVGYNEGFVRIFNLGGVLVHEGPLNGAFNTIATHNFQKGAYIAQVTVGGKTIAQRFVR